MDALGFIDPNLLEGNAEHVQIHEELGVISVVTGPRPCVDCGLMTGNYCETFQHPWRCYAAHWIPTEDWGEWQRTPFCTVCEPKFTACHFCRGVASCRPFTHNRQSDPVDPLVQIYPKAAPPLLPGGFRYVPRPKTVTPGYRWVQMHPADRRPASG